MKLEDVSFTLTKYNMKSMTITIPGVKKPFGVHPDTISKIIIEKDFDECILPFFEIDVMIPSNIYRQMRKKSTELEAFVDLEFGAYTQISPDKEEAPLYGFGDVCKALFSVILEEITPDLEEAELERAERQDGIQSGGMELGNGQLAKLLLYKKDQVNSCNQVVNAVLSSTSLADAILYVANRAGISPILMSPPSNYKTFSEFVLTPIRAIEQIDRLCNEYGIHSHGTTVFLDFKKLFLLNKKPQCTAWIPNEFKRTYLFSAPKSSFASLQMRGNYSNGTERYSLLNIVPQTLHIGNDSVLADRTVGGNLTLIDAATGAVSSVKSGADLAKGTPSLSRVLVSHQAGVPGSAIANAVKETSKVITCGFSYVNLNMLDANKEYIVMIDDSRFAKYNGTYRITKMLATMEKEGKYFVAHVTATFKG